MKIVSLEERRHEEVKDTNVRLRHLLILKKNGITQSSFGYIEENLGELWVMWLNIVPRTTAPQPTLKERLCPRENHQKLTQGNKKQKTRTYAAP